MEAAVRTADRRISRQLDLLGAFRARARLRGVVRNTHCKTKRTHGRPERDEGLPKAKCVSDNPLQNTLITDLMHASCRFSSAIRGVASTVALISCAISWYVTCTRCSFV